MRIPGETAFGSPEAARTGSCSHKNGANKKAARRPPLAQRGLGENFVQHLLRLFLVDVGGESHLGDEDLAGPGEHPLLSGR